MLVGNFYSHKKEGHLKTKLKDWIRKVGGYDKASKKLRVSPHTVEYWAMGKGTPTVKHLLRISRLSGLDFQTIINDTNYKAAKK